MPWPRFRDCLRLEFRRRQSLKRGHGMFELRALLLKQCQLRVGGIEDRLLLRDIEARDRATLVSALYQLKSLFLKINSLLYNRHFGIKLTQLKIVGGQFG